MIFSHVLYQLSYLGADAVGESEGVIEARFRSVQARAAQATRNRLNEQCSRICFYRPSLPPIVRRALLVAGGAILFNNRHGILSGKPSVQIDIGAAFAAKRLVAL